MGHELRECEECAEKRVTTEELHDALHEEMFNFIKRAGGVRYCKFCDKKVVNVDGKMELWENNRTS